MRESVVPWIRGRGSGIGRERGRGREIKPVSANVAMTPVIVIGSVNAREKGNVSENGIGNGIETEIGIEIETVIENGTEIERDATTTIEKTGANHLSPQIQGMARSV